ncbi:hypothetical protein MKW92_030143 [Papaver armeniacum]|nr:hypothetical protein MKW92_030143 [Papaver armeniacum]
MADKATGDQSSYPSCSIAKIIQTTDLSVSIKDDGEQDVLVKFLALNSDGKQVVVNNKQLKVQNPQLLCSYYEQNLRYSFLQRDTKE